MYSQSMSVSLFYPGTSCAQELSCSLCCDLGVSDATFASCPRGALLGAPGTPGALDYLWHSVPEFQSVPGASLFPEP